MLLKDNKLQKHLVEEYNYAVNKMRESQKTAEKLYYFSVIFGVAQRLLNFEWNRDLATIHITSSNTYKIISSALSDATQGVPRNWEAIINTLTEITSDLADYCSKNEDNREELFDIIERFAEVSYAITGNGSYLLEKGIIKL